MKHLLLLFIFIYSCGLKAQTEVSLLTAPFSIITETKLFFPIGIEVQSSDRWALYMETAISRSRKNKRNNDEWIKNEKTYSVRTQLRRYSQKKMNCNFKLYVALEAYYRPSYYTKKDGVYFAKSKKSISFSSAKVSAVNHNLSLKMGSKFIASRFILDFNIGITYKYYTVRYDGVVLSMKHPGSRFLSSSWKKRDMIEVEISSLVVGGSIRVGYLLM